MSRASEATQFKAGWRGGPGRPKKEIQEQAFAELWQQVEPAWPEIVAKWVARARKGDLKAIESLTIRVLGMPKNEASVGVDEATAELLRAILGPARAGAETSPVADDRLPAKS